MVRGIRAIDGKGLGLESGAEVDVQGGGKFPTIVQGTGRD